MNILRSSLRSTYGCVPSSSSSSSRGSTLVPKWVSSSTISPPQQRSLATKVATSTHTATATTTTTATVTAAATASATSGLWASVGSASKLQKVGLGTLGLVGCYTAACALSPDLRHKTSLVFNQTVRVARVVRVGSQMALDYKRHFPSDETAPDYHERKAEVHQRNAERLLALFRANAGIYVKVGQHMACLVYLLPVEYTSTLAVMQNEAPERGLADVAAVLREDLGGNFHQLFREFDVKPIAAASLAQVHVARLHSGEKVAVKIQHNGLSETCKGDTLTITVAVRLVEWLFPEFTLGWLVDEMNKYLPLELDFTNEGRQCERLEQEIGDYPQMRVPRIHWDYTTKRVLTMEYIDGVKISDRKGLEELGADPAEVVQVMTHIFSQMMFVVGYVHCDPHPGNLFVIREDGLVKVVVLDHGLYEELGDEFRVKYCELWDALINYDEDTIADVAQWMGVGYYQMLASMITARSWTVVQQDLGIERSDEELDRIRAAASDYLVEVVDILASVPPQLLLLLKTNDLLRSISAELELSSSASVMFPIMARYCYKGLHSLDDANNRTVMTVLNEWIFELRVRLASLVLWLWA